MRYTLFVLVLLLPAFAGEDLETADLRMKVRSTDILRFTWDTHSVSTVGGQIDGRAFSLSTDSALGTTLILKGQTGKHDDGSPVSIRMVDASLLEKRSLGPDASTEVSLYKGHIKVTENGKVVVDSDNDIGLKELARYQQRVRDIESSEVHAVLDFAGHQTDVQGDSALVESIKQGAAKGIFPILAGKDARVGESWEDGFSVPQIVDFKLSQPAVVRSKMTFSKWELKDGRRLARIEISGAWDSKDLFGENPEGMLVEITKVNGHISGSCLFDPLSGHHVSGNVASTVECRIDGEKDGHKASMDVKGKTNFTFAEKIDR